MATSPPVPVLYLVPKFPTKKDEDQSIPLFPGEWTVGRDGVTDIALPVDTVSRVHARLIVDAKGVTVIDQGSTNGIYVGLERILERRIAPGTEIRFGEYPLVLSTTSELPVSSQTATKKATRTLVPPKHPLRPAQSRVLVLLLHKDAFTEKEIAAKLHRSPDTVHNHVQRIFEAYEVSSRTELLMKVFGIGYDEEGVDRNSTGADSTGL